MTRPSRLIAPLLPALVSRIADEVSIHEFSSGRVLEASGSLGRQTWQYLEEGTMGPALQALPPDQPLRCCLETVGAAERQPLTDAAALRLGSFDILFVELTHRCTARCRHCYAGAGPRAGSSLDERTCHAVIEAAARVRFGLIQLTGGEPLLCPFLPELVAQIAELEGPVCEIYTNGTLLDDAALERLAPCQPRFAISFYAASPAVHDAITNLPGSHARTSEAIRRILARGLRLRVNIIVMPENAGELQATVDYLRGLGVEKPGYGASYGVGRGERYRGSMRVDEEPTPPEKRSQGGRLCVAADGSVYPCIFNRTDRLGHLCERGLDDIVEHPQPPADCDPDTFMQSSLDKLPCTVCRFTGYARRLAACS